MTTDPASVTLAVLGEKIDNLSQIMVIGFKRCDKNIDDHEDRIRDNERAIVKSTTLLAALNLFVGFIASIIGVKVD